MDLLDALKKLNPEDNNDWTDEGLPRLDVVNALYGRNVTRAELKKAAPGFSRHNFHVIPAKDSLEVLEPGPEVEGPATYQDLLKAYDIKLNEAIKATTDANADLRKIRVERLQFIANNAPKPLTQAQRVKAIQKSQFESRVRSVAAKQILTDKLRELTKT